MVPQDVPQLYNLQPLLLKRYRELEEARAFNNWLGERRQAQEGQRHLSWLTEAVHRQVPQLRYARAERRRGTGGGRSCATVMKTLRARLQQRPRFEQVVGYLERNEPLPLDQPDRKATSFVTSHFYLDDFVQSSEDPNPRPLQHTPLQSNSRGRLPHSRRGHGRRCAPCAEVPRVRRNPLC